MAFIESSEWDTSLPGWLYSGQSRDFIDVIALVIESFRIGVSDVRYGVFGLGEDPTFDAVPFVSMDRALHAGFFEPVIDFYRRASLWRQIWRNAGKSRVILEMVAAIWGPSPPKMRIVREFGWASGPAKARWTTRETDGTFTEHVEDPSNFDWDGVNLSHRAWLVIYAPSTLATAVEGLWGDGISVWGESAIRPDGIRDKLTWGTNAFHEYVARTRSQLDLLSRASIKWPNVILAFDPASFDPTSPAGTPGMPDGTWGRDGKLVGGTLIRSRNPTARYWAGV